jgi:hypothetical protein
MEIILAIVVASAVIFFGALVSLGNERQRKAIDGLQEQVVLWAVQDLRIKREHLARTVQVPDPLDWLNKAVSKVYGYDLQLQVIEMSEEPPALVCISAAGGGRITITPLSPTDLRRIGAGRQKRLSRFARHHPLLLLRKGASVHELSLLNGGLLFDLELPLAWKGLTGKDPDMTGRLWIYS